MNLVLGGGNLLRGDDAVGPVVGRRLLERGLPEGTEVADGGTAGMDVAFRMRGADRVVLLDAAATGGEPGSIYRLHGDDVAELPDLSTINLHSFRWDHALAFAKWLFRRDAANGGRRWGPDDLPGDGEPGYPAEVVVYLIEAASFGFGDPLSPVVDAAADRLVDRLLDELSGDWATPATPGGPDVPAGPDVDDTIAEGVG